MKLFFLFVVLGLLVLRCLRPPKPTTYRDVNYDELFSKQSAAPVQSLVLSSNAKPEPPQPVVNVPLFQGRKVKVHDLDRFTEQIRDKVDTVCGVISHLEDGEVVTVAGVVDRFSTRETRKNSETMGSGVLNDPTGSCEFVMFPQKYQCYPVQLGDVVLIKGYVKDNNLVVQVATVIGTKKTRQPKKETVKVKSKAKARANPNQICFGVEEN